MSRLLSSLRSWRSDLWASALERRILWDPADIGRRCAAAAHYCRRVERLSAGRAPPPAETAQLERELLGRAAEHLEVVLQRCNDASRLHATLTRAVGPRLFYRLPRLTAHFMRKIGLDRECLEEFDTRSEFEERATQYHFANALVILKASGEWELAQELYDEALALEWRGRRPIRWQSLRQTPAVYVEGLEHRPFWEGDCRPRLATLLEERCEDVRSDLEALLERRRADAGLPADGQVPAYPALVEGGGGVWDMLQLYSGRRWNEEACELAPKTAALLRESLPSADVPYVHYNTEEAVLFLLAPGSRVRLHNGGSNVPINLSLGLFGCEGSHLEVAGEARPFQEGRVVAFDDGSDHRVWHEGPEERWVLTVRTMHPELAAEPARFFSRAFTRRTCFETWDERRDAELGFSAGRL
eukprot:TRINITY_DN16422_c0_g1_i1.p1 TRINITY_DN16422_c0_g1~~TRINITY_DN16422_c0_g1_i1.p1  ORF type:complete len:414 (-),score=102.74 TRINITY_DN16422_c0_g1_i1:16-1257(-)